MNPIPVTPRAAPVTANEARMGTAAGVAERIAELKAMAEYFANSDAEESARLYGEAMRLEGVRA